MFIFKRFIYSLLVLTFISPLVTFAGTITDFSFEASDYHTGATATYTFSYTIETASPNMVLYTFFPVGFSASGLGFPLDPDKVHVTINGTPAEINTDWSWGTGRSFAIRLVDASLATAGAQIVVTAEGVVNGNTAGANNWGFFVTAETSGQAIDAVVTSPVMLVSDNDEVAPILTEVQDIPENVRTGDAVYHFSTDEACNPTAEPPEASIGEVELLIDETSAPGEYTAHLNGMQVGGTYSFSFRCTDESENESNTLEVGPFTIIPTPNRGGSVLTSSIVPENPEVTSDAIEQPVMPEPTPAPVSDQPNTETLVSTESLQLTQYIHIDRQNDASEVMKLQKFLNKFEGEELVVDGVYKKVDYEAVKRFQRKYADKVLAPWGITEPTGYVYKKTVEVINNILKNNEDKKDNINIETIPVVLPKEK